MLHLQQNDEQFCPSHVHAVAVETALEDEYSSTQLLIPLKHNYNEHLYKAVELHHAKLQTTTVISMHIATCKNPKAYHCLLDLTHFPVR